jgi:acyl-CoA synthetase (AMP-forming)/AMP-acid ligase II
LRVSVIGMPDPMLSEWVCAYIQPKAGVELSFEDVISFLKGKKVSVLQLPERIEFIDDMPLTEAQKPDRKELREDIRKKLAVSEIT